MAGLAAVLVLCIIILIIGSISNGISKNNVTGGINSDELTNTVVTKTDSIYGSLILVNNSHEYTFPENVEHLSNMYIYRDNNGGGYGLLSSDLLLHSEAMPYAHKMLTKMTRDSNSADYVVSSAYRSYEAQAQTGSVVLPGFSDHHTGYCFSLKRSQVTLSPDDYEWISNNAHNYGFIIRYPDEKASATGVNGYTNCLRYVGTAHANYMVQNNLCLEEYIDFLKNNAKSEPLKVKCDNGEEFYVYYYEFKGKQTDIKIPKDSDAYPYTVSGTNDGGIVVTIKVK